MVKNSMVLLVFIHNCHQVILLNLEIYHCVNIYFRMVIMHWIISGTINVNMLFVVNLPSNNRQECNSTLDADGPHTLPVMKTTCSDVRIMSNSFTTTISIAFMRTIPESSHS